MASARVRGLRAHMRGLAAKVKRRRTVVNESRRTRSRHRRGEGLPVRLRLTRRLCPVETRWGFVEPRSRTSPPSPPAWSAWSWRTIASTTIDRALTLFCRPGATMTSYLATEQYIWGPHPLMKRPHRAPGRKPTGFEPQRRFLDDVPAATLWEGATTLSDTHSGRRFTICLQGEEGRGRQSDTVLTAGARTGPSAGSPTCSWTRSYLRR
jgi:hypothetical protein